MLLQNSEGGGVTQPTTRPDQDLTGNPKRGGDLKVSCSLKPCKCSANANHTAFSCCSTCLEGQSLEVCYRAGGATRTLLGSTSWPLPVARQELFSGKWGAHALQDAPTGFAAVFKGERDEGTPGQTGASARGGANTPKGGYNAFLRCDACL